ncbi:site-specific DNA-methyltransferase [Sandarakinorhabdus sp.]|uniref:DNA-methyltransferase n=1 Tax=Sandarakinorhabdus sp. TaxID=1916663 RepID=UPI003565904E
MTVTVMQGDCRAVLPTLAAGSVQCCVTSPPYFGLRDYGVAGQIGLEPTPDEYVAEMVAVFKQVKRVLRDDGTLWLNIGDSYANIGHAKGNRGAGKASAGVRKSEGGYEKSGGDAKHKDLLGIPYILALALRADGWYWRDLIVWAKPNGMPGSQEDRCTSSHETILFMSKSERYYSDFDAIKTPPRESSLVRLAQDVQAQAGSHRGNGGAKGNGPMKAVPVRTDKQRGHSRRHAGFNERWDAKSKVEQSSSPAMMRNVWFVATASSGAAHFAVMPDEIARRCILAGSQPGDTVLDPFGGAGTTGLVADRLGRSATLIELNAGYRTMAVERIAADAPLLSVVG